MIGAGDRASWLAPLVTAALVFFIGSLVMSTYPQLSPVDELQHVDSAIKASQGRWYLPPGELVGQDAMRVQACAGIDAAWPTPACTTPVFDPNDFQELGINTAAGRPSAYYIATGYLGRAFSAVTGVSLLTSARLASLLGLSLGAAFLTWAALRLSRSPVLAVSLGVLCATFPTVLSAGIWVNPDSWSLLAGTAVTALSLWAVRRSPLRVALALSLTVTLAVLVKPNFLPLALVPIVVLGVAWWRERDKVSAVRFAGAVLAAVLAGVAFVGTMIPAYVTDSRAQEAPQVINFRVPEGSPWPVGAAIDNALQSFVPVYQPSPVDALEKAGLVGLAVVAGVILVAGSVAALMTAPSQSRMFALGLAGVLGLIATPASVFAGQFVTNSFFAYPQRYSFIILPVLALAWAAQRPRRPWLFALVALTVVAGVLYGVATL